MDLNGDGFNDILSGCYSRQGQDMAGIFQVFYGTKEGKFQKVAKIKGDDGELLIIPAKKDDVIERICTRPTAADLNGDGHMDIIAGNFGGHFYVFNGLGKGKFEAKAQKLMLKSGKPMHVQHHSDPFLIDWDKDGDLDLLSGSNSGGVFLFTNHGDKKAWSFGVSQTLVEPVGYKAGPMKFGDAHITGPQMATRVYVDDLNEDGKWDLLVGDNLSIFEPAEGLTPDEARKKHAAYLKEREALMEKQDAKIDWQKMFAKEAKIISTDRTGFVWVYYQK